MPDGGGPLRIVDAHHHVWCPERRDPDLGYGWLRDVGAPKPFGDPTPIQRDYLFPEYLSETRHHLVASVHVQTDGALPDPVAETAWVASEARAAGHPLAIVGLADLAAPDLPATLDGHLAHPETRGIRQIVAHLPGRPGDSFAARDLLADPAWRRGLGIVAEAGLSFELQLHPEQADAAAAVLAELPGLPVIVDHALSPRRDARDWDGAVRTLARREATAIKLSGWGMFDPGWTADSIAAPVARILDAFGSERVMWGSNFPVEKLARGFDAALAATLDAVDRAGGDPRAVFAGTALRIYRLSP